jgi:hypothetical protein
MRLPCVVRAALVILPVMLGAAHPDEQAAIDGCIDRLREVGGPDAAAGGRVESSEYSEAGTLVMLRDAGETLWRCLAANDGTVEELGVAEAADDGGGAIAGAPRSATETVHVKFSKGSTGAVYGGSLTPGSSTRYVLGARKNQFLSVRVAAGGPGISYQIFNPDQSFLLDMMSPEKDYRGQLWQSGDHVVEVINRGNHTMSFKVTLSIK